MTEEEILAMGPGLELNIKVAEEIMGSSVTKDDIFGYVERYTDEEGKSVWDTLHAYSEDISVAESVVKKMLNLGYDDAIYWAALGCGVYTEPEAICKAALLALLE